MLSAPRAGLDDDDADDDDGVEDVEAFIWFANVEAPEFVAWLVAGAGATFDDAVDDADDVDFPGAFLFTRLVRVTLLEKEPTLFCQDSFGFTSDEEGLS